MDRGVEGAVENGLHEEKDGRLCDVLGQRVNAFRRALQGDPTACVEPKTVTYRLGAQVDEPRPRRYDPQKASWLAACMAAFVAFGLAKYNL